MARNLFKSALLVLLFLVLLQTTTFAQNPDSVFFGEISYHLDATSLTGKLQVPLMFANRNYHIFGLCVPLLWIGPVNLDSVNFAGSRFEQFTSSPVYYEVDHENHKLHITAIILEEPWELQPGRGLLATIFFDITDTGWVEIDTAAFGNCVELVFVDENGYPRFPEFVKGIYRLIPTTSAPGDANVDGTIDLLDVVFLINYLFRNGPLPLCFDCADVNCDEEIGICDVVYLINYIFRSGPAPQTCEY